MGGLLTTADRRFIQLVSMDGDLSDLDRELLPARWPSGAARGPAKMRYTHEAMADLLINNPTMSQNELAEVFGYSPSWISQIICCDAFKALMAKRRDKLVDPVIAASIKEQFEGLAARCMEVLRAHMDKPAAEVPAQLALQGLKVSATALGYGARTETARVEVNITAQLDSLAGNLEAVLAQKRGRVIDSVVEPIPEGAPA